MTRYTQTRENNCLQTCLASIFDVPVEQAPDINKIPGPSLTWTAERWQAVKKWTGKRGSNLLWMDAGSTRRVRALEKSGAYYIATGPLWNGDLHCVVMRRGEIVHDPAGFGLSGPPVHYIGFEKNSPGAGCVCVLLFLAFLILAALWQGLNGS